MAEIIHTIANYGDMVSIPHAKGVAFRILAPNARKVYLIGTFKGGSEASIPFLDEKNGYWSADVSEAGVGDNYRYVIHGPKSSLLGAASVDAEKEIIS